MLVQEIMSRDLLTVQPNDSAAVAARLLSRRNLGALPVTDARGRLQGIVTDRDLVTRCIAAGRDPAQTRVGQIMTQKTLTAAPEEPLPHAAARMTAARLRRLPVVSQGRLVGMLTQSDLAARVPEITG